MSDRGNVWDLEDNGETTERIAGGHPLIRLTPLPLRSEGAGTRLCWNMVVEDGVGVSKLGPMGHTIRGRSGLGMKVQVTDLDDGLYHVIEAVEVNSGDDASLHLLPRRVPQINEQDFPLSAGVGRKNMDQLVREPSQGSGIKHELTSQADRCLHARSPADGMSRFSLKEPSKRRPAQAPLVLKDLRIDRALGEAKGIGELM